MWGIDDSPDYNKSKWIPLQVSEKKTEINGKIGYFPYIFCKKD